MSGPYGVTDQGFSAKPADAIRSDIQAYLRSKISKNLRLDETSALGNVVNAAVEKISELWQAAEGAYNASDVDNADDAAFVADCALTGTIRHGASVGTWATTCTLGAGLTFAPGTLVANVAGQSTNRWQNRDPITSTSTGDYPVTFVSQLASSKAVGSAGTLVIAQPLTGWLGVTTTVDATPGEDQECIQELETRREQELQGSGSGPLNAIRARVSRVKGVISVRAIQNTKGYFVGDLPPHSYRLVIWDGPSPRALSADIGAAILAGGSAGIASVGASSVSVPDPATGTLTVVPFDRAAQVPIYVKCTVTGTATAADVQAAIIKAGGSLSSGNNVIAAKISAAIADVPGVTDLTSFGIGTSPSPGLALNIPIPITSIGLFALDRIVVTLA